MHPFIISKMKQIFLIGFVLLVRISYAASVDTITISSKALHQDTRVVIVLPYSYSVNKQNRYPVVYLLHGYSGNYANWITRVPEIAQYADQYQIILVCPDGKNSWYINSRVEKGADYESYISSELVNYIDSAYRTISSSNKRAICGLSMGGHGAIYLAIKHQDIFTAAGSMSGVLDLAPYKNKYGFEHIIGDTTLASISRYSDIHLANTIGDSLSLIIDCGISDPFIGDNRHMHERLIALKIPHDYIERNGGHNWPYWRNAIAYQLLFFKKHFSRE